MFVRKTVEKNEFVISHCRRHFVVAKVGENWAAKELHTRRKIAIPFTTRWEAVNYVTRMIALEIRRETREDIDLIDAFLEATYGE